MAEAKFTTVKRTKIIKETVEEPVIVLTLSSSEADAVQFYVNQGLATSGRRRAERKKADPTSLAGSIDGVLDELAPALSQARRERQASRR